MLLFQLVCVVKIKKDKDVSSSNLDDDKKITSDIEGANVEN